MGYRIVRARSPRCAGARALPADHRQARDRHTFPLAGESHVDFCRFFVASSWFSRLRGLGDVARALAGVSIEGFHSGPAFGRVRHCGVRAGLVGRTILGLLALRPGAFMAGGQYLSSASRSPVLGFSGHNTLAECEPSAVVAFPVGWPARQIICRRSESDHRRVELRVLDGQLQLRDLGCALGLAGAVAHNAASSLLRPSS